ncbi:lysoplasmalogenase family protein [Parasphingorhabdus halotolerans]|uniref:Lysoplasmalogenase n=1 Tax=Parasphingorhabdus halotolerans TaxID=2725558 RepID=A0A6H2DJ80_9SPHN|nr:lysoplasmalogenase family protein [Parasphingorhabdus halotolerans]QJB68197.1 lysoplasmalogenase [Parasphingorhabdus halotolerans]
MKSAIIDSRPYLMLSLLFGISYYFVSDAQIPGTYLMLWKGAAVGFLAVYAFARLHRIDGKMLGIIMALGALGDMVIEFDQIFGAAVFIVGHIVAIIFYARYRRHKLAFSQKLFAILLVPISALIAFAMPDDRSMALAGAAYCVFAAAMAAMAWTSRFPRYRVGVGAVMFVVSDLLIISRMGPLETSMVPDLLIWPLYYIGQFLIATGVVQTLRHEMAAESADPVPA